MKQLNEKLARWSWPGADEIDVYQRGQPEQNCIYVITDGVSLRVDRLFTESYDACDKWLVPKLIEGSSDVCISFVTNEEDRTWLCEIEISRYQGENRAAIEEATGETQALAFCRAIEKLVDAGKSNA